jgi:hypothetical protein
MKLIRTIVDGVGYVQGVVKTFNECVKLFRTMREEQKSIEVLGYPDEESFGKFIQDNFKQGGVIEKGNYPDSIPFVMEARVEDWPRGFNHEVYNKITKH